MNILVDGAIIYTGAVVLVFAMDVKRLTEFILLARKVERFLSL